MNDDNLVDRYSNNDGEKFISKARRDKELQTEAPRGMLT